MFFEDIEYETTPKLGFSCWRYESYTSTGERSFCPNGFVWVRGCEATARRLMKLLTRNGYTFKHFPLTQQEAEHEKERQKTLLRERNRRG